MTTDLPEPVADALAAHDLFTMSAAGAEYESTPFAATVDATPGDGERDGEFEVVVRVPTIDAVVDGETVAPVVEDGWYDTFERRTAEAFDVTKTTTHEEPSVERRGEEVVVTFTYTAWDAETGVADAKALADYVEGTYVQGVIPGYDYTDPVAGLLASAAERAGADGSPR